MGSTFVNTLEIYLECFWFFNCNVEVKLREKLSLTFLHFIGHLKGSTGAFGNCPEVKEIYKIKIKSYHCILGPFSVLIFYLFFLTSFVIVQNYNKVGGFS